MNPKRSNALFHRNHCLSLRP